MRCVLQFYMRFIIPFRFAHLSNVNFYHSSPSHSHQSHSKRNQQAPQAATSNPNPPFSTCLSPAAGWLLGQMERDHLTNVPSIGTQQNALGEGLRGESDVLNGYCVLRQQTVLGCHKFIESASDS